MDLSEEEFTWKQFNQLRRPDDVDEITENMRKEWVSGTAVKHYLLKDPCLDWIKNHFFSNFYKNNDLPEHLIELEIKAKKQEVTKEKEKFSALFTLGNKFEDHIIRELQREYPLDVVIITDDSRNVTFANFEKTISAMKEGVPIIAQAVLYNHQNRTRGTADLIVRSDYLNKIFDSAILSQADSNIKAPHLPGNYHYRVIDIKWTTLHLCADGRTIRNSNRFPAYKGQLAIYNAAIGLIQGYTAPQAYIMGKSWKYIKSNVVYEGSSCYDLLAVIDYDGWDCKYLKLTSDAIKWVRNVRYNGHKWKMNPPSIPELYPNMCNRFDTPYHGVKQKISNEIDEITQIWMVGPKHRQNAHNKGIYKWTDPKCCPETLGIKGKKVKPLVEEIIRMNRDKSVANIEPAQILNNYNSWQNHHPLEFFIDFESLNECFYDQNISLRNSFKPTGVLFMLGIGYVENGEWQYKTFSMNKYNPLEERRIVSEFFDFIDQRVEQYNESHEGVNQKANLYYWGHAETSLLKRANERHGWIWNGFLRKYIWTDFLKVFKDEPVLIKGCKKFGLKEIGKKLFGMGLIHTKWETHGPSDGLTAMIQAAEYYRFINSISVTPKLNDPIYDEYNRQKTRFDMVTFYNEVDCKVVYEIIDYLRRNHTI